MCGGGGGGGCLHKFWTFCLFCPKTVGLDVQRAIVRCDHSYSTVCTSLSMMDNTLECIFRHIYGVQPRTAPSCIQMDRHTYVQCEYIVSFSH